MMASRIPLWIKLLYTGFLGVLVPYYWHIYGPTNFLYFCDFSLFLTLIGLWREEALWVSMPAVGILLPQAVWTADLLAELIGTSIIGIAAYMFDRATPGFVRSLSLFHIWLPLFMLWILNRLGYDRRAFLAWTIVAWGLLLICYFLIPAPPAPPDNPNLPVNINYVYGFGDAGPQSWMPPLAYLALVMIVLPACVFWPTHRLLIWFFPPSARAGAADILRSSPPRPAAGGIQ